MFPAASTAIPFGLLKYADAPCPSAYPVPEFPTKVETIPVAVTFLIHELKSSIT